MPSLKLTEKSVAKLKAPTASGKQQLFWDDELKGFGVLCSGISATKTYVVQRTLPGGKSRRVSIGPTNVLDAAEARSRAEKVLSEFLAGRDPKAGRLDRSSLRDALAAYLKANNRLSAASRKFYKGIVERHLADWLDLPLRELTPEMVQARHHKIQKAVAAKGNGKGFAIANSVLTALRIIINFAAESSPGLLNPVRGLKRQWFAVPRRTRMVKFDQLPEFYRATRELENPIHRDLITLLLFTGLRLNEALGLRWEEIDFAAGMIRIPAERMKGKRPHNLPMSDLVRDLLVARRQVGRAERVFLAAGWFRQGFVRIAEQTGISISAHDLRRTHITIAESCDISPLALKALVAHSSSDVTSGYVQMSPERLREAAQRVADKLKELCGIASPEGANVATWIGETRGASWKARF